MCADTCAPPDEVAVTPDVFYFAARLSFPDSVAATVADAASFAVSAAAATPDGAGPGTCPCGEDALSALRSQARTGDLSVDYHLFLTRFPIQEPRACKWTTNRCPRRSASLYQRCHRPLTITSSVDVLKDKLLNCS
jgi:hypothetical protein